MPHQVWNFDCDHEFSSRWLVLNRPLIDLFCSLGPALVHGRPVERPIGLPVLDDVASGRVLNFKQLACTVDVVVSFLRHSDQALALIKGRFGVCAARLLFVL